MNTDDPNNPQGGGVPPTDIPTSDASTPPAEPAQETAQPMMGGNEPAPATGGMDATSANCHCGKPSAGGNCTGCNQPEAACSCTPAV